MTRNCAVCIARPYRRRSHRLQRPHWKLRVATSQGNFAAVSAMAEARSGSEGEAGDEMWRELPEETEKGRAATISGGGGRGDCRRFSDQSCLNTGRAIRLQPSGSIDNTSDTEQSPDTVRWIRRKQTPGPAPHRGIIHRECIQINVGARAASFCVALCLFVCLFVCFVRLFVHTKLITT